MYEIKCYKQVDEDVELSRIENRQRAFDTYDTVVFQTMNYVLKRVVPKFKKIELIHDGKIILDFSVNKPFAM